jgi:hypothetical protein
MGRRQGVSWYLIASLSVLSPFLSQEAKKIALLLVSSDRWKQAAAVAPTTVASNLNFGAYVQKPLEVLLASDTIPGHTWTRNPYGTGAAIPRLELKQDRKRAFTKDMPTHLSSADGEVFVSHLKRLTSYLVTQEHMPIEKVSSTGRG